MRKEKSDESKSKTWQRHMVPRRNFMENGGKSNEVGPKQIVFSAILLCFFVLFDQLFCLYIPVVDAWLLSQCLTVSGELWVMLTKLKEGEGFFSLLFVIDWSYTYGEFVVWKRWNDRTDFAIRWFWNSKGWIQNFTFHTWYDLLPYFFHCVCWCFDKLV